MKWNDLTTSQSPFMYVIIHSVCLYSIEWISRSSSNSYVRVLSRLQLLLNQQFYLLLNANTVSWAKCDHWQLFARYEKSRSSCLYSRWFWKKYWLSSFTKELFRRSVTVWPSKMLPDSLLKYILEANRLVRLPSPSIVHCWRGRISSKPTYDLWR